MLISISKAIDYLELLENENAKTCSLILLKMEEDLGSILYFTELPTTSFYNLLGEESLCELIDFSYFVDKKHLKEMDYAYE